MPGFQQADFGGQRNVVSDAQSPKLPAFVDGKIELDSYLLRFERFATNASWHRDGWATKLSALLPGRALELYSRMSDTDAVDKIRFHRGWLSGTAATYDGVTDLMVKEQFIGACTRDLAVYLKERAPKYLDELAVIAKQYLVAHGRQLSTKDQHNVHPALLMSAMTKVNSAFMWLSSAIVDNTGVKKERVEIDTPYLRGTVEALCVQDPIYELIVGNVPGARPPNDPDPVWNVSGSVTTSAQAKKSGTPDKVYNLLNCAIGPDGNQDNSYLTFLSRGGLMFGIINVVGNFGTVFVDQSYWQSSVAAKPRQGVWGFITGGLTWFAIPFTFATTMGLAYVALSTANGEDLLTESEINEGLVPPTVAYTLMGKAGAILMTLMILMAVTSTGSAEVIAVASILVYDLYQIHWRPYRAVNDTRSCLLCGKHRDRTENKDDQCECYSMSQCKRCWIDDSDRSSSKAAVLPTFKCPMHGPYRTYLEVLIEKKNWCIFWVAILIVPLTLLLQAAQVSLGWVYLFMGVVIGSSVVPIALTVFWTRLNGKAAVIGTVGGTLCGLTAWLVTASTFDGGLSSDVFLKNTGKRTLN
uniref:Uncharacterized protein LOC102808925 n=1 Tax=Saccoglossus kowalevskii TaxID=10224 RepID=A0ABM0MNT0_SACKO|nr:PREDICTED: uncharacterized protein LOC102808925 [Saccoglossus kowalevskii]